MDGTKGAVRAESTRKRGFEGTGILIKGKTEKNKLTFSLDTPHIPSSSCDSPEQRSVRGAAIREESVSRVSGASRHFFVPPLSCLLPAYTAPSGKWGRHLPVCCSDWSLGGMDAAGTQPSLACRPQPFVAVRLIPLLLRASFGLHLTPLTHTGTCFGHLGRFCPRPLLSHWVTNSGSHYFSHKMLSNHSLIASAWLMSSVNRSCPTL